jgi:hypothetical protein
MDIGATSTLEAPARASLKCCITGPAHCDVLVDHARAGGNGELKLVESER